MYSIFKKFFKELGILFVGLLLPWIRLFMNEESWGIFINLFIVSIFTDFLALVSGVESLL